MKVARLCPTLCDPMDYTVYGILQVRIREWVAFPFFRESSQPGIEPRSPVLQADSLPAEPQGKPKNTGVGSLSLLQQIFLTQELDWGLLHCRQILYQLSYEGSKWVINQSETKNFLVVQCLRIHFPMQGTWVWSLVGELRFHMLWAN